MLFINNYNNYKGHFYGAGYLARSRAQCAVQKAAENCINTYNGQHKKVSGHTTANHTRICIQQLKCLNDLSDRMGSEFTFWKLKRFCTGDGAMVTDAQVRYTNLCECIRVVCIIWSVSVAVVGVILVDDSISRVRHSSVIVESQKECDFSKSISQYGNKRMSA